MLSFGTGLGLVLSITLAHTLNVQHTSEWSESQSALGYDLVCRTILSSERRHSTISSWCQCLERECCQLTLWCAEPGKKLLVTHRLCCAQSSSKRWPLRFSEPTPK